MKIKHRDGSVTDYGSKGSKGLSDYKSGSSSGGTTYKTGSSGSEKLAAFKGELETETQTQTNTALEAEKEQILKQTRFNANVKSLMNAGFTRTEAEDLAAYYFDDTDISISKILSNAPQNSTVKLSDGRVTTVSNAAKIASSSQTFVSTAQVNKLQSAIDDLAEQYKEDGISKKRYLQQVAYKIRNYDDPVQNYLLNYSKKAAGIYGEARETAAFLVDVIDAYTVLPAGVAYSVKHPETITAAMSQSVKDTASGTVTEFKTNPRRATTNLLAILLVTHGVIKVGSKVSSKLPATKTYIKNVSKVTVKTTKVSSKKLRNVIDREIVAVERRTNTQLYSKAKQYERTYRSYLKSKSSSGKATARRELSKIENEINNIIKEKNAAQRKIKSVVQKYKNESYTVQKAREVSAAMKERKRVAMRSVHMKKKAVKAAAKKKKLAVKQSKPLRKYRKTRKAVKKSVKATKTKAKQSKPAKKVRKVKKKAGEKKQAAKKKIKSVKKTVKGQILKDLRSLRLRIARAFKRPGKYGLTKRQLERMQQELKIASDRYKAGRINALELRKKIRKISKEFDEFEKAERARDLKPVNIKIKKSGSTTINKQGKKIRNMGAEFRKASKSNKNGVTTGKGDQALMLKTELKATQKTVLKAKQKVKQSQQMAQKTRTALKTTPKTKTAVKQKTRTLVTLRTATKTQLATLQAMRTQLKTQQRVITSVRSTQKTLTAQKASTLSATKQAVAQLSQTITDQRALLKRLDSRITTLNKLPVAVIPKVKKPSTRKSKASVSKKSNKYGKSTIKNRVITSKQLLG